MTNDRPVIVCELPERLNSGEAQAFFGQVREVLSRAQPRVVFDLALLHELDATGVQMLLQCLEEVMKRNGDLKLAAVPPRAAAVLELTSVDRLFEIFENAADAVESFHRPLHEFEQTPAALYAGKTPGEGVPASYMAD